MKKVYISVFCEITVKILGRNPSTLEETAVPQLGWDCITIVPQVNAVASANVCYKCSGINENSF